MASRTLPEDRAADAHHRCSFRDRQLRDRRTCPSTSVSSSIPRATSSSLSSRNARNWLTHSTRHRRGLGNRHQPAQPQARQDCRPAAPARPASAGRHRSCCASPLMLTWMHSCRAARCGGRCSDSRCATFSRSTLCTQWKCSAMRRVLLLWIGPMKCHSQAQSRSQRSSASCRHLPARSSRRKRAGRNATASRTASRGKGLGDGDQLDVVGTSAGRTRPPPQCGPGPLATPRFDCAHNFRDAFSRKTCTQCAATDRRRCCGC